MRMHKRNGFTLLELLIAAAIIAVLAAFATQSFRQTGSEIRLQDAQARAKTIAMAAHRLKVDYPGVKFSTDAMGRVEAQNRSNCSLSSNTIVSLQTLIDCGYLDYRQYMAESREDEDGTTTYFSNFSMSFRNDESYEVCFQRRENNTKILDANKYCTDGEKKAVAVSN